MENLLIPYEAVTKLGSGVALVLAPHPDDEVFGCAGAILRHVASGDTVHVVILSDGEYRVEGDAQPGYREMRRDESRRAAAVLGYGEPEFWALPDRGIEYGEFLVRRIEDAVGAVAADLVYAPSIQEMHPDHRALGMAALEALRRRGGGLALAMYEVGVAMSRPNRLLDISDLQGTKQDAMACYSSQLREQPYDRHIASLNRFRTYTLPVHVTAAEAYCVVSAQEALTDFLGIYATEHERQRALGLPSSPRDVPLVSVIIRSMDRPTLKKALDSVALQTYSNIEVMVVNAKGSGRSSLGGWCGRFPMRVVGKDAPLNRAAAANLGLDGAAGNYVIFLDDDGWFAPHHIHGLVQRILREPTVRAVYSDALVVDMQSDAAGVVLNEEFDPVKLMGDNFLPIHSVLFDRGLVADGCRCDEALDVHEDWDFWLQVSGRTPFAHVEGIGAYCAAQDGSQAGPGSTEGNGRWAREMLFEKWKGVWKGEQINALLAYKDGLLRARGDAIMEAERALCALKEQLQTQVSSLSQRDVGTSGFKEGLAASDTDCAELRCRENELLASTSWGVTWPFRWLAMKTHRAARVAALAARFVSANGGGVKGAWKLFRRILSAMRKPGV